MSNTLKELIPKLAQQKILVVGDVILDKYIIGEATRLSREAAIPVLEFREEKLIAGGAANPSANIVALGSQAIQIGVVGDDLPAKELQSQLQEHGIQADYLVVQANRPTTVKMRILAQMGLRFPQQLARVDTLSRVPIDLATEQAVLEQIQAQLSNTNAVLFSDYHNGMLTPDLVEKVREIAQKQDILLTVDTQGQLEKYQQFDVVKCNASDAMQYLGRDLSSHEDFAQASEELYQRLKLRGCMVITRGADGASLASQHGIAYCPAPMVRDVYDTVGAGDTSIAVMTLAISAQASCMDAVQLANYASGIVIQHLGNYTPSPEELLQAVE